MFVCLLTEKEYLSKGKCPITTCDFIAKGTNKKYKSESVRKHVLKLYNECAAHRNYVHDYGNGVEDKDKWINYIWDILSSGYDAKVCGLPFGHLTLHHQSHFIPKMPNPYHMLTKYWCNRSGCNILISTIEKHTKKIHTNTKSKFPDYSKMSQEELHEIYDADYPITVPTKGNFMRMKPEKEAEKHKATAMRFIEWKRDLDERAANQIKKRRMREAGIDVDALDTVKKSGYAMSSHAIQDKYEREGLIVKRFVINKEKKKKGIKYWKRYIGGHFRPRRSSTKRWNHMWTERMVLDRKTKKRGSYLKKSINRT